MSKCRTSKCNAACCYNICFKENELERFYTSIINPVIYTISLPWGIMAKTNENMDLNKCPFLRKDLKCNIYENRPEVCRLMGIVPQMPCEYLKESEP